ncbi:MAG: hypothetical protein ABR524_05740 [Thermoanaerobaculia bacterium]
MVAPNSRTRPTAGALLALALGVLFILGFVRAHPPQPGDGAADASVPSPQIGDPLAHVESSEPPAEQTPSLVDAADAAIEQQVLRLSDELGRMWTQEPESLVRVIEKASRSSSTSPPVTLLLAIAHAETHGKILTVSEAAAVGLAQATPVAYLLEGYGGKLFLTDDYFRGVSAYIVKKPLGDADAIATRMLDRKKPLTPQRAARLHEAAVALRREGLEELEVLRGHAPAWFFAGIESADRRNEAALTELERLIRANDRARLTEYRDRIRKEYRDLRSVQKDSWKQYQKDLMAERDATLVAFFGIPASEVNLKHRYLAADILAERVDGRFSPERMAEFLVRHLARKAAEAEALETNRALLEQMTAALYNGGALNVKRMMAGLITSLPETERYSVKVPTTRQRLDQSLAGGGAAGALTRAQAFRRRFDGCHG